MLKLSLHTDLISQDFDYALKVAKNLDFKYIDLRTISHKSIVDLTDEEVRDVANIIKRYGLEVSSLSPFLFFLPLREREDEVTRFGSYSEHLTQLKRAVELAKLFDTDLIKCWCFLKERQTYPLPSYFPKPFSVREKIIERFQKAIRIAEEAGVILAMECCPHSNAGTGIMVRSLIDELGSKNVRLLWDPCNSFFTSGQDVYPYEYQQVKDYIVGIDVKDKNIDTFTGRSEHALMGEGKKIFWPEILQALVRDDYQGILVLESEYTPTGGTMEDGTRANIATLKNMMSV